MNHLDSYQNKKLSYSCYGALEIVGAITITIIINDTEHQQIPTNTCYAMCKNSMLPSTSKWYTD